MKAARRLRFTSSCASPCTSSLLLRRLHGSYYRKLHSHSTAHPKTSHLSSLPTYLWRESLLRASSVSPWCSTNPPVSHQETGNLGLPKSSYSVSRPSTSTPRILQRKPTRHILPNPQSQSLRSSFGSWTAAIVVGALVYLFSVSADTSPKEKQRFHSPHEILDQIEEEISKMTGESLPGRPGTLTPEQEEKLKEFWVATFQVFGVMDSKDAEGDAIAELPNGRAKLDEGSPKKTKKKRLGLFRKGKDGDTDSTTSSESRTPTSLADGEDKYGQAKDFHQVLANQSPELLRTTFWSMVKHDHPDALLLRFLRARKWDIEKALVMMISTMKWRATDMHVDDDVMKNGELGSLEDSMSSDPAKKRLGSGVIDQTRMGKSFLHGCDKAGRPMCYVRARLHKAGEQSEESLERYTVFTIESARMTLSPPVDTACVVFDLTGFSMANMDYTPVKFMIKCFEANYPESLGVVLIHKAPWVFQGIWKIVKGWLDPVVASKVHFTNNNADMAEFVPESHVIKELGGQEDWEYHYIEPIPGENDKMKDIETRDKLLLERELLVKDYENSTLDWIHGVGDVAATNTKRHELAIALKDDYWRLDPYIRARSFYDRSGMIQEGGKINFYTETKVPAAAPAVAAGTNGTSAPATETSADDVD